MGPLLKKCVNVKKGPSPRGGAVAAVGYPPLLAEAYSASGSGRPGEGLRPPGAPTGVRAAGGTGPGAGTRARPRAGRQPSGGRQVDGRRPRAVWRVGPGRPGCGRQARLKDPGGPWGTSGKEAGAEGSPGPQRRGGARPSESKEAVGAAAVATPTGSERRGGGEGRASGKGGKRLRSE